MNKAENSKTKKMVVFDFDGTLTLCDSFPLFIFYAVGFWRALWGFALYMPLLVMMKAGLYPNGKTKEKVLAHFFTGTNVSKFRDVCREFARTHKHILRPQGVDAMQKALAQGAEVVVLSASPRLWVQPFFSEMEVNVIGTELEEDGQVLSGFLKGANCYGREKVNRLKAAYPSINNYNIVAYGDSRGDKELLQFAHEAHYKPFR